MGGNNPYPDKPGAPVTGRLFILSAPSGAGKTTLCRALMDHFSDMIYSVSTTTRQPRKGEKDGADYFFISREEFEQQIRDHRLAEWARVHENYYGTSVEFLDTHLALGRNILLDIDVQGTRQIIKRYPDCITIFIMPPSFEALKDRMTKRAADATEVVEKRLQNAKAEMAQKDFYRHVIVNDRLEDAAAELIALVDGYLGKST
jgi:guanylate kinase